MEGLFLFLVAIGCGWWLYKSGKRLGSRKGFNAGRRRGRNDRRRR